MLSIVVARGSPKFQCQLAALVELSVKLTIGLMMLVDKGAVKLATGLGYTVIMLVLVAEETHPPSEEVTVNPTVYDPGVLKQCEGEGKLEVVPSKVHAHVAIVPPATVELSIKVSH